MALDNNPVNDKVLAQKWYFFQIFTLLANCCYFLAFCRKYFMKYIENDESSSKTITPLSKMGYYKFQAHLVLLLWDKLKNT